MNWYEITKKYNNNINYKNGSWDIEEGLDCLTLMLSFFQDMGKDISELLKITFIYKGKEMNAYNYKDILGDTKERNEAFTYFLKHNFVKIDKIEKGCIIFYKSTELVGIYLGSDKILTVFEEYGLKIIKVRPNSIKEMYKWA